MKGTPLKRSSLATASKSRSAVRPPLRPIKPLSTPVAREEQEEEEENQQEIQDPHTTTTNARKKTEKEKKRVSKPAARPVEVAGTATSEREMEKREREEEEREIVDAIRAFVASIGEEWPQASLGLWARCKASILTPAFLRTVATCVENIAGMPTFCVRGSRVTEYRQQWNTHPVCVLMMVKLKPKNPTPRQVHYKFFQEVTVGIKRPKGRSSVTRDKHPTAPTTSASASQEDISNDVLEYEWGDPPGGVANVGADRRTAARPRLLVVLSTIEPDYQRLPNFTRLGDPFVPPPSPSHPPRPTPPSPSLSSPVLVRPKPLPLKSARKELESKAEAKAAPTRTERKATEERRVASEAAPVVPVPGESKRMAPAPAPTGPRLLSDQPAHGEILQLPVIAHAALPYRGKTTNARLKLLDVQPATATTPERIIARSVSYSWGKMTGKEEDKSSVMDWLSRHDSRHIEIERTPSETDSESIRLPRKYRKEEPLLSNYLYPTNRICPPAQLDLERPIEEYRAMSICAGPWFILPPTPDKKKRKPSPERKQTLNKRLRTDSSPAPPAAGASPSPAVATTVTPSKKADRPVRSRPRRRSFCFLARFIPAGALVVGVRLNVAPSSQTYWPTLSSPSSPPPPPSSPVLSSFSRPVSPLPLTYQAAAP